MNLKNQPESRNFLDKSGVYPPLDLVGLYTPEFTRKAVRGMTPHEYNMYQNGMSLGDILFIRLAKKYPGIDDQAFSISGLPRK